MADSDVGKSEMMARGMRAEKYLDESRYWFGKLREAYKESIARAFESAGDGTTDAVAQYGAQIAVLADIEQQLESLAAEGEIAARDE